MGDFTAKNKNIMYGMKNRRVFKLDAHWSISEDARKSEDGGINYGKYIKQGS